MIAGKKVRVVLLWSLVLIPLWIYFAYLPRFGYLQNNDYYYIVNEVLEEGHFSTDPRVWLAAKSNEHRATVPALIYAANIKFNHGNNRALTLFVTALMGVIFILLYRLLPAHIRRGSVWVQGIFVLPLAAFVFIPVAAHNVAMGFSGTQWFLANALAIASIVLLFYRGQQGSPWRLWPIFLLGLVACLTYSTGLAMWPALVLGALFLGVSRRHGVFILACGVLVCAFYWVKFETLSYHPEPNTYDLVSLVRFLGVYFGSLFTKQLDFARMIGWCGLASWTLWGAFFLWRFYGSKADRWSRRFKNRQSVWAMVQFYALASALGTAVGRSMGGEHHALASRYASLPGLFWVAFWISVGLWLWPEPEEGSGSEQPSTTWSWARPPRRLAWVVIGLVLVVSLYRRGIPVMEAFAARATRQEVAALSLGRGYTDRDLLFQSVTQSPQYLLAVRDFLKDNQHVPFDQDWPVPRLPKIDQSLIRKDLHEDLLGSFQEFSLVEGESVVRVRGWAFGTEAKVEEVLLLNAEEQVCGEIVGGVEWGYLKRHHGAKARRSGWEGYVEKNLLTQGLNAYVRRHGDPHYYALPKHKKFIRQLKEITDL